MTNYEFSTQLLQGQRYEEQIDAVLKKKGYLIYAADQKEQRSGIDRWVGTSDGSWITVEYKTDVKAASTGNLFIETISVDIRNILGWAYTTKADTLIFYLPQHKQLIWMCPKKLRELLPHWKQAYPERTVQNAGWNTKGILVPVSVVQDEAFDVMVESDDEPDNN